MQEKPDHFRFADYPPAISRPAHADTNSARTLQIHGTFVNQRPYKDRGGEKEEGADAGCIGVNSY